jgi:hypothetical protein
MTAIKAQTPLRDVLYAFSVAKAVPDDELLDEFVRRYPGYATEIIDFAVEIVVDAARGNVEVEESGAKTSPAVSRAMSRFQNRLFELRQKGSGKQASSLTVAPLSENPFSGLDREGFRQFANRLGANTVFVVKLRDRQIDPNTMSTRFQKRVADELSVPLDVIVAHFAARTESQTGKLYKSDQKPTTGIRQSFQEAVQSSGLTPEQQRHLLDL